MSGPGRAVYSISAVARMLGLPAATIRTREDRYGLVVPERNASGHRLYRRGQVEQPGSVKACVAGGATAADAHRLPAERMEGAAPVLDCRDRAVEAGAGAFLLKPLDPLQLVPAVRDLPRSGAFLRPAPGMAR